MTQPDIKTLEPLLNTRPHVTLSIRGVLASSSYDLLLLDNPDNPRAIVLRDRNFYYFYADPHDTEAAHHVLSQLPWSDGIGFAAFWEPLLPLLQTFAPIAWEHPCLQFHLDPTEAVHERIRHVRGDALNLRPLKPSHADLILTHWPFGEVGEPSSEAHIRERLAHALTTGWYEGEQLVSWAMTHRDTSTGYMHTLDAYRRRGIGLIVATDLLFQVIQSGRTPFCHIVQNNEAPRSMLTYFDYESSPGRYFWLGTEAA